MLNKNSFFVCPLRTRLSRVHNNSNSDKKYSAVTLSRAHSDTPYRITNVYSTVLTLDVIRNILESMSIVSN